MSKKFHSTVKTIYRCTYSVWYQIQMEMITMCGGRWWLKMCESACVYVCLHMVISPLSFIAFHRLFSFFLPCWWQPGNSGGFVDLPAWALSHASTVGKVCSVQSAPHETTEGDQWGSNHGQIQGQSHKHIIMHRCSHNIFLPKPHVWQILQSLISSLRPKCYFLTQCSAEYTIAEFSSEHIAKISANILAFINHCSFTIIHLLQICFLQ